MTTIDTARLRLRHWNDTDLAGFAALNANPDVMRFFPAMLTREQSDAAAQRYQQGLAARGYGFWAVERKEQGDFIGFIGIQPLKPDLPCAPGVEIGWRLASHCWRKGYASEGAKAVRDFAFQTLQLSELKSITPIINQPSRGVMEKIGMCDSGANFLHPLVSAGHPLHEHVMYQISSQDWLSLKG